MMRELSCQNVLSRGCGSECVDQRGSDDDGPAWVVSLSGLCWTYA